MKYEFVILKLEPTGQGVGIKLQNKTEGPIKVDWSSASFVDINWQAHGVIHYGVKL